MQGAHLIKTSLVVSIALHLIAFGGAFVAHHLSQHVGTTSQEECFMVSLIHIADEQTHTAIPPAPPSSNKTAQAGTPIERITGNRPVADSNSSASRSSLPNPRSGPTLDRKSPDSVNNNSLQVDFSESAGVSNSRAVATYQDAIAARISQAKRYPEQALKRGITGQGRASIEILPDGSVKSSFIVQSTSSAILDQEMQDMILRAAPFPAFPAGLSQSSVSFVVPISFAISQD